MKKNTPKTKAKADSKAKTKARKAEAPAKATRVHVAAVTVAAVKKPTPIDDFIKAANAAYIKAGGDDNLRESKWACGKVLSTMEAIGLIQVEGGQVQVVGKVVAR